MLRLATSDLLLTTAETRMTLSNANTMVRIVTLMIINDMMMTMTMLIICCGLPLPTCPHHNGDKNDTQRKSSVMQMQIHMQQRKRKNTNTTFELYTQRNTPLEIQTEIYIF